MLAYLIGQNLGSHQSSVKCLSYRATFGEILLVLYFQILSKLPEILEDCF